METKTKILIGIGIMVGILLALLVIYVFVWMSFGIYPSDTAAFDFMNKNEIANKFAGKYPDYHCHVKVGSGYSFGINMSYKQYLKTDVVDEKLMEVFNEHSNSLSCDAKILEINDKTWEIIDNRSYIIKEKETENNYLWVYYKNRYDELYKDEFYSDYYPISYSTGKGNRTLTLITYILFEERNKGVKSIIIKLNCLENNNTIWTKTDKNEIITAIEDDECFEERPKQITKEQAIAIANATEELQEFLKLYPNSKFSIPVWGTKDPSTFAIMVSSRGEEIYHDRKHITHSLLVYIGKTNATVYNIDLQSGGGVCSSMESAPQMRSIWDNQTSFLKNEKWCDYDTDCFVFDDTCYNFLHIEKYRMTNMCDRGVGCKCINNTCAEK